MLSHSQQEFAEMLGRELARLWRRQRESQDETNDNPHESKEHQQPPNGQPARNERTSPKN